MSENLIFSKFELLNLPSSGSAPSNEYGHIIRLTILKLAVSASLEMGVGFSPCSVNGHCP
jgi:hypothetical protein